MTIVAQFSWDDIASYDFGNPPPSTLLDFVLKPQIGVTVQVVKT